MQEQFQDHKLPALTTCWSTFWIWHLPGYSHCQISSKPCRLPYSPRLSDSLGRRAVSFWLVEPGISASPQEEGAVSAVATKIQDLCRAAELPKIPLHPPDPHFGQELVELGAVHVLNGFDGQSLDWSGVFNGCASLILDPLCVQLLGRHFDDLADLSWTPHCNISWLVLDLEGSASCYPNLRRFLSIWFQTSCGEFSIALVLLSHLLALIASISLVKGVLVTGCTTMDALPS